MTGRRSGAVMRAGVFNVQTQNQVRELMGMSVTDTHGTKVGTIKQVYLNDDSGAPEWVTVHTGWFGMRESFVPLSGARRNGDVLQVPYDKETIKGAPNVDADEHLSHAQIVDLYRHYGVRPPSGRRTTGDGAGAGDRRLTGERDRAASGSAGTAAARSTTEVPATGTGEGETGGTHTPGTAATAEAAAPARTETAGTPGPAGMAVHPERQARRGHDLPERSRHEAEQPATTEITRCEERLHVGTERHESGRVRVRKWVETEMVERTVPVSREEVRIDREPIVGGRPDPEARLSEDERVIILYEERPLVSKETVPVERVVIRTEQVRDEQTVRGEIRKERIEVIGGEEAEAAREDGDRAGRRERGDRAARSRSSRA